MTKYRALTRLSLRKRPDPKCEDWLVWQEGEVFEPPPHMNIEMALAKGKIELAKLPRSGPTTADEMALEDVGSRVRER